MQGSGDGEVEPVITPEKTAAEGPMAGDKSHAEATPGKHAAEDVTHKSSEVKDENQTEGEVQSKSKKRKNKNKNKKKNKKKAEQSDEPKAEGTEGPKVEE